MEFDWSSEVVARMHAVGVTGKSLAQEAGITHQYLSMVLHGKKGSEKTHQRICAALSRIENSKRGKSV